MNRAWSRGNEDPLVTCAMQAAMIERMVLSLFPSQLQYCSMSSLTVLEKSWEFLFALMLVGAAAAAGVAFDVMVDSKALLLVRRLLFVSSSILRLLRLLGGHLRLSLWSA